MRRNFNEISKVLLRYYIILIISLSFIYLSTIFSLFFNIYRLTIRKKFGKIVF